MSQNDTVEISRDALTVLVDEAEATIDAVSDPAFSKRAIEESVEEAKDALHPTPSSDPTPSGGDA